MPTVDLPAHNVRNQYAAFPITIVGGPECLANLDTASYIEFDPSQSGFLVGAVADGSPSTAKGFGTFDAPPGAIIEDYRFVAQGWVSSVTPYPPGTNDGYTNDPLVNWPSVLIDYIGAAYIGGYNLSTFDIVASGNLGADIFCAVQPNHPELIFDSDSDAFGLTPTVTPDSILGFSGPTIRITYLCIRITYSLPTEASVRRIYPRDDGLTGGARRTYPPNKSQQCGRRTFGDYL